MELKRNKTKYKTGATVVTFAKYPEMAQEPYRNENITAIDVTTDVDGDGTFRVVLDGRYIWLPSEMLVLRLCKERTHDGHYKWKVVKDGGIQK